MHHEQQRAARAVTRVLEGANLRDALAEVDDAARRLANDLRRVPGIERFGAMKLNELDRSGPRPLRTMWRIASEQLDAQYGQLTIGELLEMYGQGRRA